MRRLLPLALLITAPAFADPLVSTITEGNAHTNAPESWLGATPHIVFIGTINGYDFDAQFMDLNADFIAGVDSKREYLPEGEMLRYADFEFGLQAIVAGVEKTFELEFENHDFSTAALPATFDLQSEEFPMGALSNLEFEFEWEGNGTSVNEEIANWTGTLTLELDSGVGTSDPQGDGMIGGYVDAKRGDDHLVASFTVPVNEYEIDE
ncbi:hypothetical protein EDD53_2810 [Pacificibacter maritimus]|uniref:Polyisoprenoid-binding protein YceI n=1 Tax=Pacificibacter maritimus TaxID=762213 RepID=A0A3N4TXD3_9RHOB|nr:hypothetical protein [Pacificibacter maritimus]RPE63213.1 hypothetical protein EDD53_2810 [Pacificibacter maritimus]